MNYRAFVSNAHEERKNSDFFEKKAVITGAASGIGLATALAFARAGAKLVVCDLPSANLVELETSLLAAGATGARALGVDVSQREQMSEFCVAACREGVPDVLVNNAGVGLAGGLLDTTLEDWSWILGVNLWGVVHGCHFFAPRMAERGQGQIINVASAAGFYNSEAMAAYGTTKYAVIGLSEALRAELAPRGVGVSVVCPGLINTSIVRTMRMRGARYPESERANVQSWYERRNYGPERVAVAILRAARHNPALLPVTPEAWALYLLARAVPSMNHRIVNGLGALFSRRGK